MEKKKVWGKVLVIRPRLNYYSSPVVCLEGTVDIEEQDWLHIKLPNNEVVIQEKKETLCLGKKAGDVKFLLGNFQSSLDELKNKIQELKTYNLMPTPTVIMAENPKSPSDCSWEPWEVDFIVRANVIRSSKTTVTLDILDEDGKYTRCPIDSVFACESDEQWQSIQEKYIKLQKAQAYLTVFLRKLPTYDERIKSSRKLKAMETAPSTKVRQFKDALISNPSLSLRSVGNLVGLSGRTAGRYYNHLERTLPEEERSLIRRQTVFRTSAAKQNPVNKPPEQDLDYGSLLEQNKQLKERFHALAQQVGVSEDVALKIARLGEFEREFQKAQQEAKLWQQKYDSVKRESPPKNIGRTINEGSIANQVMLLVQDAEERGIFIGRGLAPVKEFIGDLIELVQPYCYPLMEEQASQSA